MKDITKKYSNGEVTVVWKPTLCIHSENCFHGLPEVFNPNQKPWITPDKSTTDKIIGQIKKCPSGALSYFMNNAAPVEEEAAAPAAGVRVEPAVNGPLMVHGDISVKDSSGNVRQQGKVTAFCRCGHSGNKPYCDGSHKKVAFVG
ncbi:MAG: (4Fe-4S)-binding protein [Cytophagales bacterium]|nr:(4Fe-4S)-binding protein [Cytophagales bacterium]